MTTKKEDKAKTKEKKFSLELLSEKKKLIVYSEIMKPKFDEGIK